jgi:Ca2+-binding RTX toxin-like protein
VYWSAASGVIANLTAGVGTAGDAAGDKFYGIEGLEGSNHADTLTGDGQGNTLYGWGGNDLLLGEGDIYTYGNDYIEGGDGADTISGGGGHDWLLGNAGRDVFRFDVSPLKTRLDNGAGIAGVDTLADFSAAEDRIALETSAFGFAAIAYDAWGSPVNGTLAASAFKLGTSASTTAQRIVYDQASGAIYYDADGLGGQAQVQFAKVAAGTALSAVHFQLLTL